jgi:predicted DNA-binding transcriptional regulator YafY
MKKNQKALIRQTTIFSRLNAGETANVKVLAEKFDVGIRAVQKDMNE